MKRSTALAIAMVVIAAITALWFSMEQYQVSDVQADAELETDQPPLPRDAEGLAIASNADEPPVADVDIAPQPQMSTATVQLFSPPDQTGSEEYREAYLRARQYVGNLRSPTVSRSQLLKRNQAGVDELVRLIETDAALSKPFDITPFGDVPCTVSSIDRISPPLTPGVRIPGVYEVYARCNSSPTQVSIGVNKVEGYVTFGLTSGNVAGYTIVSLDDSDYSVAYERLWPLQ